MGVVTVRLFRPFSAEDFLSALPASARSIGVLDRTKEPGALGEPLYLDVLAALDEGRRRGFVGGPRARVIGGRYGLSSKEFTPAMVQAVITALRSDDPPHPFTVGITDDVTHLSLPVEPLDIEPPDVKSAVFFGLGSDGTVGANKNSVKIIGEETDSHAQGYFVYDSKKSGAVTVSHLRFGPRPIHAPYLVEQAGFVACHQFDLIEKMGVVERAAPGAVLLLNAAGEPGTVWGRLSGDVQRQILAKGLQVYAIDAGRVAHEAGLGGRINTIMQVCFFALSGVLPAQEAAERIKEAAAKSYGRRGLELVRRNAAAVDASLACLHRLTLPAVASDTASPPMVSAAAPDFVKRVSAVMMSGPRRPAAGQRVPSGRHLAGRDVAVGEAEHRRVDPGVGPEGLHPVQPVRAGVPARRHPRQALRARAPSRARPRRSSRRASARTTSRESCTRSRWPRRTARAARSAWRCARRRTGRTRGTRRSTWRRSRRCGRPSARTSSSSWACPSPRHSTGSAWT